MSPTGAYPTEEELEVARILCRLPDVILQFDLSLRRTTSPPLFPDDLRWGARRRRRSLPDGRSPLSPPPFLPPPPTPAKVKEGSDACEGTASAAASTSSPATPLSFPGSGGEDNDDARPCSTAPSPPPAKQFKNPKRHKEWVEEQRKKIASLANDKANLKRVIEEYRSRIEGLRASNSVLREVQAKAAAAAMNCSQTQNHQRVVPVAHPPAAAASRTIPDLNALPEEGDDEAAVAIAVSSEWVLVQQSVEYYRVASTEARKRRREIQREKSSCSPWTHTSKALRLR